MNNVCERKGDILDKYNEIRDFFNSSFAEEFIRYNNVMARAAAAAASAVRDKRSPKREDPAVRDYIMQMTCNIMRAMEISSFAAADIPVDSREVVDMPSFQRELIQQCGSVTGGRAEIVTGENTAEPFIASLGVMRYIFLGQIRKLLAHSEGMHNTFCLTSRTADDGVHITLEARERTDAPVSGNPRPPEMIDAYPDEVCRLLAERMGAEMSCVENGFTLHIPPCDFHGDITLHSEAISPEGGDFTPYSLMLSDLTDSH